jgi:hypothetical protein
MTGMRRESRRDSGLSGFATSHAIVDAGRKAVTTVSAGARTRCPMRKTKSLNNVFG